MKRPIAALGLALAVALVVWRTAARSTPSAPAQRASSATAAIAKRRTDLRQTLRAELRGHVTSDGTPIAGAHVCAHAPSIGELGRDATCTETDATGSYVLAGLYAADYGISAVAPGMKPATEHRHLVANARETVDLALATGGVELAGTVSDIAGGPIAHAQIRADDVVVEADDRGMFSLWVAPDDVSIEATADGYAPASWSGRPPDRADLRLFPESSLAGTVVGADGAPVAGASVSIAGIDWHQPSVDTSSDDDGAFRADRLAPGRYTITVRTPNGYGTSDESILVAMADHTDGVVITLAKAFHIAGTLVTEDGGPCTSGGLHVIDDDHARTLDATADNDGEIEVDGVLPGTYRVLATCSDYVTNDSATIEIRDHDVTGQLWKLEAGATLRGKITMRDGAPIGGAEIQVHGPAWTSTTSATDGSYALKGLTAGSYSIQGSTPHASTAANDYVDVGERETVEHDLVMDTASAIRGVVVDTHGAPVAGANVHLRDGSSTRTSADGSFVLEQVTPGEHELAVEIGDHYFVRSTVDGDTPTLATVTVTVALGEIQTTRLVIEREAATVAGVVRDGTGAPMRDVVVELADSSDNAAAPPVLTGDDGRFRFAATQGASYHLHASAAGRGERLLDVKPGDPVEVMLESAAITGIVEGAPGELSITLSGPLSRTESFFHTGGRFALHDLRSGRYHLTFDSESGHTELDVDDSPAPLDITLEPVFTLSGQLVHASHAPIVGVHVQMSMNGQRIQDGEGALTDPTGHFIVRRARKGTAELRLIGGDVGNRWLEQEITGPQLDLVLDDTPAIDEDSRE
jgi:protocatechuate 3,4-dioxygenase beta subunit